MLERLLKVNGVNVNARGDKVFCTPLHLAAQKGNAAMVSQLLNANGIIVDSRLVDGDTPFHDAAYEGRIEVLEVLLQDQRIRVNLQPLNRCLQTPIHHACSADGTASVVSRLLAEPQIDPNGGDEFELTPLHTAARNGKRDIVKVLLSDSRVLVNARDDASFTPFLTAARRFRRGVMKIFLADECTLYNAQTYKGDYALHLAAERHTKAAVRAVKLLLRDERIDVARVNHDGATALHKAAGRGCKEVLMMLLEDGRLDPCSEDYDGKFRRRGSLCVVARFCCFYTSDSGMYSYGTGS